MGTDKNELSRSSEKPIPSETGEKKRRREDSFVAEDRGRQKQKLPVFVEEPQGMKTLQNMRSITTQAFARASGVKVSAANSFIKSLESKGVLKNVGGYSGHRVYKLIQ